MDEEAFDRLRNGNDSDARSLYGKYRQGFVTYICHAFQCRAQQAGELYPEAFSILYFNLHSDKLTTPYRSTMQTYLNSIGWHLYHKRFLDKYTRGKVSMEQMKDYVEESSMVDAALLQKEKAHQVRMMLDRIGDPCRTILQHVYLDESPYKVLAEAMNTNEAALRKRKFDCLGKLRKLITELKLEY